MIDDSMTLGAVSVQYDDYLGTAAADDADALLARRSLYQMVGLDRDQWLIVSVDLTRSKQSERVTVYAIDKFRHRVKTLADVEDMPDSTYGVPVVAFELPSSVRVQEFMIEAFQRISVRLISHAVAGQKLNIAGRHRLEEPVL